MIAGLNPYSAYKPCGVEWLGDVPAHWEVRRLRNVADMRVSNVDKHVKDDEIAVRLCNYVDVYKNDCINERMDFMRATATREEIERFRLEKDDVLITKDSETWDDIGVPTLVTEPASDLISGYHLALLRPRPDKLVGAYLLRALQSKGLAYQFHIEAKGVTRYGLSHAAIKSVWLPLPSLPEQMAIARFLDHADRRIQRYIRAKQKLIALLEEQKQAIIHQAVTGQVDVRTGQPYPAYKPSGVEWLGEVPAHWEEKRLKSIARIRYGLGQPPHELADGLPLIRATNVDQGRITRKNLMCVDPLEVPKSRDAFLSEREIIVVRSGAYTADSAIIPEAYDGTVAGYDMIVTVREAQPEFIAHALLSNYVRDDQLITASMRSAQPHLNSEELGTAIFTLPPLDEQNAIVACLDSVATDIETATKRARRHIELLQEYRTRLIADVVTGKLDVRETATALPDTAPFAADDALETPATQTPRRGDACVAPTGRSHAAPEALPTGQ